MSDKKFTFFNDKPFYILLVDLGDFELNKYDWNNPNYIQNLIENYTDDMDTFIKNNKDNIINMLYNNTKNYKI